MDHAPDSSSAEAAPTIATVSTLVANPDEIQVEDEEDAGKQDAANPDEIDIGDIEDDGDGEGGGGPPVINPDEINVDDV